METGERFPEFTLQDENGETFDSSSLKGRRFIIFFYPKDSTPGCTRENQEFSDRKQILNDNGVEVIGVSKDSVASHRKFVDKYGLKTKLLSDPEHTLLESAGAWGTKISYGKETTGTIRSTFLVGADGIVEKAWRNVKVADHAEKVTQAAIGKTQ